MNNKHKLSELLNAAFRKDAVKVKETFDQIMRSKIRESLARRRIELSKHLFGK